MEKNLEEAAQILWNYHKIGGMAEPADIIFVMGSNDIRVAEYAADLYLDGYAPKILFSGGIAHQNDLLRTNWAKSEAETFARVAIDKGVPVNQIIIEMNSTNSGENIVFSTKILAEKRIKYRSILAVQKPYMERRALATMQIYWPDKILHIVSPHLNFTTYPNATISRETLIHLMVGDLQRIIEYPAKGFQISQEVPENVYRCYQRLVNAGFTKHMLIK